MDRPASVLAPDLDRDELLARLRALQPAFVREGITRMWLIGSRARGDNRRDSDIDLILTFRHQEKPDLFQLSELCARIESWFDNRFSVDLALGGSLKPDVAANMAVDSVKVF